MAITADQLDRTLAIVDDSIKINDLARHDWRRQTDLVKEVFTVARMFADLGSRTWFVDGRLSRAMLARADEALQKGQSPKAFFNARCHDAGLKSRRGIVFDTVTTNGMGDGRGNSRARLHFHGVFELPEGWSRDDLLTRLHRVFGRSQQMGKRQFHFTRPDWNEHFSHKGVTGRGPVGKLLYAVAHAGATYASLKLNADGKRSRRAPVSRGADTRGGTRLARGVPSAFNREVVFFDQASVRAGREAFEGWVAAEKARRTPVPSQAVAPTSKPTRRTGTDG